MIPASVVSDGGNTSDGLTHTSVGSRASALGAGYTQNTHRQTHFCARPQLCSCDSNLKSDNLAAERKRDMPGLIKTELLFRHPGQLVI